MGPVPVLVCVCVHEGFGVSEIGIGNRALVPAPGNPPLPGCLLLAGEGATQNRKEMKRAWFFMQKVLMVTRSFQGVGGCSRSNARAGSPTPPLHPECLRCCRRRGCDPFAPFDSSTGSSSEQCCSKLTGRNVQKLKIVSTVCFSGAEIQNKYLED